MTTGIRAGANASQNRLAMILETAWGTTPATPAFQNLRLTDENLSPAKQTVRSDEIRPDRNVPDEIMVGRESGGDINFELSYGTFDLLIRSLMFNGDWATNVLKNGAGVGDSLTIERTVALPSGSFDYHRFVGCVVNEMSLDIAAGEIITGSFGIMGKWGSRGAAIISGATYTPATTEPVMSAASQFGSLTAVGIATQPKLRNLSLNITNNLRRQDQLGSIDNIGLAPGRCEVSGSFEAYFENADLFDAYLNHTDLSLTFTLGSTTLKKYTILLPTIKLSGDPGIGTGGNDEDVMATMNFTAIYDRLTSEAASIKITRAVA